MRLRLPLHPSPKWIAPIQSDSVTPPIKEALQKAPQTAWQIHWKVIGWCETCRHSNVVCNQYQSVPLIEEWYRLGNGTHSKTNKKTQRHSSRFVYGVCGVPFSLRSNCCLSRALLVLSQGDTLWRVHNMSEISICIELPFHSCAFIQSIMYISFKSCLRTYFSSEDCLLSIRILK